MTNEVEQALYLMLAQNQSRWRKTSIPETRRKPEQEPRYSYRGYTTPQEKSQND